MTIEIHVLRYAFGGAWKEVFKRKPLALGNANGGSGNASFEEPVDLAVSTEGEVYVLDKGQRCVQVFTVQGDQAVFLVSFGRPGRPP